MTDLNLNTPSLNSNNIARNTFRPERSAPPLSEQQRADISNILSRFDPANLNASDARSIVSAFEEAGIQPSREFASFLQDNGFDARQIGALAGISPQQARGEQNQGQRPPPPRVQNNSGSLNADDAAELVSLLEEALANTDSSQETSAFDAVIESFFNERRASLGNLVDIVA